MIQVEGQCDEPEMRAQCCEIVTFVESGLAITEKLRNRASSTKYKLRATIRRSEAGYYQE